MIVEEVLQWLADALAYLTLAMILYGIYRGTRRAGGRTTGPRARWLTMPWLYLVETSIFLGACYVGWRPLPLPLHGAAQAVLFALGCVLYFPGMLLALWGRMELGRNYFVSSAMAARLFEDHQLVVTGPYAIVRHPMYLGLILAAVGSVPMYYTWTTLFLALFSPMLLLRAGVEEQVLATEFREAWWAYCARVPTWKPRWLQRETLPMPQERAAAAKAEDQAWQEMKATVQAAVQRRREHKP